MAQKCHRIFINSARSKLNYWSIPGTVYSKHAQATKVPRTYGQKLLHQLLWIYGQAHVQEGSASTLVSNGKLTPAHTEVYPHIRQPRRTKFRSEETDHSSTRLQRCFLIRWPWASSGSNTFSSCYTVHRVVWLPSRPLVFQRLALRRRRALQVRPIVAQVCISVAVGGLYRLVRMSDSGKGVEPT